MRKDVHRPSVLVPEDYRFVCFRPAVRFDNFEFALAERKALEADMKATGGWWSNHEHGGTCDICGAWANSLVVFRHLPSNTYIRTGEICAEKLEWSAGGDWNAFKRNVANALEAKAGKAKAEALLGEWEMSAAWDIYVADYDDLPKKITTWRERLSTGDVLVHEKASLCFEESTIRDMVDKLVKYGSLSDKQKAFMANLIDRIAERPAREAKRAAEEAALKPIPADLIGVRARVTGEVLTIKEKPGWGYYDRATWKMLVREDRGFKLWGTAPNSLFEAEFEKGDRVTFEALIEASDDDPMFGFFKRPTKAELLEAN